MRVAGAWRLGACLRLAEASNVAYEIGVLPRGLQLLLELTGTLLTKRVVTIEGSGVVV